LNKESVMTDAQANSIIRHCKQVERPGLYIMVILILLSSCDAIDKLNKIEDRLHKIELELSSHQ
jgi:hypothetical protein